MWAPDCDRAGTSSALVVRDETVDPPRDRIYVVDLGHGSALRLAEAFSVGAYTYRYGYKLAKSLPNCLANVKAVFVTHLHMDHTTDYPALLLYGQASGLVPSGDPAERLQVYGPGTRGVLEDIFPPGAPVPPIVNPENPTPGLADMTGYLWQAYAQTINNFMRDGVLPDFRSLVSIHEVGVPPLPRPGFPNTAP
jgi:ribonuclease BN (tRNA processing enzyme)